MDHKQEYGRVLVDIVISIARSMWALVDDADLAPSLGRTTRIHGTDKSSTYDQNSAAHRRHPQELDRLATVLRLSQFPPNVVADRPAIWIKLGFSPDHGHLKNLQHGIL